MTAAASGLHALLVEARHLDQVYAAWQHEPEPGPQDDLATEAALEAAHFDVGDSGSAGGFADDDPAGSGTGWLA